MVALVGPDGSGKTTLANALLDSLRADGWAAELVHLGSPPSSILSRTLRLIVLGLRKTVRLANGDFTQPNPTRYFRSEAMLMVVLAFERRAAVTRCFQRARAGRIIITDRFPGRLMGAASGPSIDRVGSVLVRVLRWVEEFVYAGIPDPTCAIRLRVPMHVSIERNAARRVPKPDSVIEASHAAASLLRFDNSPEIEIDAMMPVEQVVGEARNYLERILGLSCVPRGAHV